MRHAPVALAAIVTVLPAGVVQAEPWDGFGDLVTSIRRAMRAHAEERIARLPDPTEIRWQARRVADFDFEAPVLDALFVDLEPGGAEELVVLTSREVVVLRSVATRPAVVARLELPASLGRPAMRPRDPLGILATSPVPGGVNLMAWSSDFAHTAVIPGRLPLTMADSVQAIPACGPLQGARPVSSVPGRNLLASSGAGLPPLFHGLDCGRRFFGPQGQREQARGVLDTAGDLAVEIFECEGEGGRCGRRVWAAEVRAGTAFTATDIDRDGYVEVIAAADSTPGFVDRVSVLEARGDQLVETYKLDVPTGVAAVSAGQIDGDRALEVVTLHRNFRRTPFEVWVWN